MGANQQIMAAMFNRPFSAWFNLSANGRMLMERASVLNE